MKVNSILKTVGNTIIEPNKNTFVIVKYENLDNDIHLLTLNPYAIIGRPISMPTGGQVTQLNEIGNSDGIVEVLVHNTSMSVHLTIDEGTPLVLATTLHKVKDEPKKGSKKEKESIQ